MMTEQENREFDIMLKSILENGTEEVPSRLWEGISARVDAERRRKAVLTWLRRGGITAAAAAAVLAAVILNVRPSGDMHTEEARTAEALVDVVREDSRAEIQDYSETITENLLAMAVPAKQAVDAPAKQAVAVQTVDAPAKQEMTAAKEKTMEAQEGKTEEIRKEQAVTPSGDISEEAHPAQRPAATSPEEDERIWSGSDAQERRKGIATAVELSGLAAGNTISASAVRTGIPLKGQATVMDRISETGESSYSIPISVGVGVKIIFTPRWALGVGVNYSILGRQFAGTYTDEKGIRTSFSDIRNTLHYIGIPLNAYFSIVSKDFVDFYAYAGGCVEKCVSNTFRMTEPVITYKEDVPGVQLSANIGIGAEFIVAKRIGIFIDPSLRYYFDNGQPKSIRTQQPLTFGVEAGIRVRL